MFELTQESLHRWEALCTQDQPPYCTARCPLHVDGKGICAAIAKGNFNKARELVEKYMLMPQVLSAVCEAPCRASCRHGEAGEALQLPLLEQAAMAYGKKKQGGSRLAFLRRRSEQIAVVGGGMLGLSVALELGMRGYQVTLLEQRQQLGGRLQQYIGHQLTREQLEQDLKKLDQLGIVTVLGTTVEEEQLPALLEQYDAVFVSTEILTRWQGSYTVHPETLQTNVEKLFTGVLTEEGQQFIQEASQGKRAAISIERFVQHASLTTKREQEGAFQSTLFTRLDRVTPTAAVVPAGQAYSQQEAQQEANRCIQCSCTECLDGCAFLRQYKRYPKQYAREVFNNHTIVMGIHGANGMINSCSLCGQCKVLCPNGFDMGEICRVAREDMVQRSKMPPSTHDFALMDMAYSNGDDYFLARHQPGRETSAYVLFPGCQLGASMPDTVTAVYQDLCRRLEGGVGLLLGCCGAIAHWAGQQKLLEETRAQIIGAWRQLGEPTVITLCPSCHVMLGEAGLPVVHGLQVLEEIGLPTTADSQGQLPLVLSVHDACTTRFDRRLQEQVRAVVAQCGHEVEELAYSREKTHCCGYGGLTKYTNHAVNDETVAQCISQSDRPYVTYCVNCRDQFRGQGKEARHVLELLYGLEDGQVAHLSARRWNRRQLKDSLLRNLWKEEIPMKMTTIQYEIEPEVLEQLHGRMILESDVVQVLEHAHATGEMMYHKGKEVYFASRRIGSVTFWVAFRIGSQEGKEAPVYQVAYAYSHRMSFEEDDTNGAIL